MADAAAVDATAAEDDKEEKEEEEKVEMIEVVFKTPKFGLKTLKVEAFEKLLDDDIHKDMMMMCDKENETDF